jgi:hypothetical protein
MTEQIEPKSKHELLEMMESERRLLDAVIESLTEGQKLEAGIEGNRNVKDLMAHITTWEKRMIQWINESFSGIVPQRPAPGMTWDDLDKLNEQTYLENKDKPLAEVVASSSASYTQALRVVQEMSDQDLFDGSRFDWRNGDPIWHMVAANTWWHYKEHREQIETWAAKGGKG